MTCDREAADAEPADIEPAGADASHQTDPKVLEWLVCPLTKGPLRFDAAAQELISDRAGLAYPIRNGVPILLQDEARPLDDPDSRPEPG